MKNGRSYSFLTVKAVDETKRIIKGIATTPTPDRSGDIVVPTGVKFQNPMPLLLHHDHRQPVGHVKFGTPTADGIPYEAEIFDLPSPQHLHDRLEEAYVSVKSGLIRAVSIGFRAMKYAFLDDGGIEWLETEVYELSLVTIPANAEATIETVKSLDAQFRAKAASGPAELNQKAIKPAGASAQPVKLSTTKENPMDIAAQIAKANADRLAKHERMKALMSAAAEAGETLGGAESEEYDTLEGEVKQLDSHIKRLTALAAAESVNATPVAAAGKSVTSSAEASAARGGFAKVKMADPQGQEPGIAFARLVKCIGLAKGNMMQAEKLARNNYKHDPRIENIIKAAVEAGTTLDSDWAGALVGDESSVFADFVEYLRPRTIIGRFGQNGIPALRRVPFRTRLPGQTSKGSAGWVGEGKGKPVTKWGYDVSTLEPLKVAAIAVVTQELLRDSSPAADGLVRDELAAAVIERMDIDFIDPAKAAVPNVSPASITNGVDPIHSSGSDADAVRRDISNLLKTYIAAKNTPANAVLIMSSATALDISMMQTALGVDEFPGMSVNGGTLKGLPVITSEYAAEVADSSGAIIVMVNASDIYIADDGGVAVDMSTETSIEMSDAPTQDGTTGAGASMVSMFQSNMAAFRAERTMNWKKRRPSAVALLDQVYYGDQS